MLTRQERMEELIIIFFYLPQKRMVIVELESINVIWVISVLLQNRKNTIRNHSPLENQIMYNR